MNELLFKSECCDVEHLAAIAVMKLFVLQELGTQHRRQRDEVAQSCNEAG